MQPQARNQLTTTTNDSVLVQTKAVLNDRISLNVELKNWINDVRWFESAKRSSANVRWLQIGSIRPAAAAAAMTNRRRRLAKHASDLHSSIRYFPVRSRRNWSMRTYEKKSIRSCLRSSCQHEFFAFWIWFKVSTLFFVKIILGFYGTR